MKLKLSFSLLILGAFVSCINRNGPRELYNLRADTLKVYNPDGKGAELQLENSTKKIVNGLLTNTDTSGLTQFRKLDMVSVGTTGVGIVGQDTIALDKLQYYLPITGGSLSGRTNIIVGSDGYRLGIMKSAGVSQSGNTTLGATSVYLQIGGGEWSVGSNRLVGFGYVSPLTNNPPAFIGYQETNKSGNTLGDLIFGTRSTTGNDVPTIRARITAAGNFKSFGPVTAPEDVATKGYVDTAYMPVKTVTVNGTYSLNGTPSNTFVANNASAASTYTMPTAKNGIKYTFWKIGPSIMTVTGNIVDAGKSGTKVVSGPETGSSISFVCIGTSWVITAKNGTWTTQ